MRNKNFLFFIIAFALFIIVVVNNMMPLVLSNTSVNTYSSSTMSDPGIISPSQKEFTVDEESIMKFKIAAVTSSSSLSVKLISKDTGTHILSLSEKDLTHSTFRKLKPGNYTLEIKSPKNTNKAKGYNYVLQISSLKDYYRKGFQLFGVNFLD